MDEKFLIQFMKHADKVRLSSEKKEEFRRELELTVLMHPVPVAAPFRLPRWAAMHRLAFASSLVGVAILISGTGASLAAERALPGDTLYPVKVSVNERVRETLAWTPSSRVEWEAQRIERRVAEADTLSSEGRLDSDTQSVMENEATQYANQIETIAGDLEVKDRELSERTRERLNQALESGTHVRVVFEKKKISISEAEEGIHDEQNESYDDKESDARERHESEGEDQKDEKSDTSRILTAPESVSTSKNTSKEKKASDKQTVSDSGEVRFTRDTVSAEYADNQNQ
jgi:hypothetical protein